MAARIVLADLPLRAFVEEPLIPYAEDEVTRLIFDHHDALLSLRVSHLTVGGFRDWLLSEHATAEDAARARSGSDAGDGGCGQQAHAGAGPGGGGAEDRSGNAVSYDGGGCATGSPPGCSPTIRRTTPLGIAASMVDGLLLGSGDAVIGINPVADDVESTGRLLRLIDMVRTRYAIPTQSCVLAHITTQMAAMKQGAPVDLCSSRSRGEQKRANASFGINLGILKEANEAARALKRGTVGQNAMYFETGQGSALSANAHHGIDQQTCEVRAYAVARAFDPMLVNTVVGFIGPEYLYDGKQILRAGLEDHFCGKLMGLPMGCDVCYTNHAEVDQDDMDSLLTLLGAAGVNYIMGVPGADDIMLQYQSTSFQDALYLREDAGGCVQRRSLRPGWLATCLDS